MKSDVISEKTLHVNEMQLFHIHILEAEVHQSDTAVNVSVVSVEEQIDSDLENLTTNHLNEQVPTTQL